MQARCPDCSIDPSSVDLGLRASPMEGPSCIARSAQDRTCLAAHQQHQLLLPVQTASSLHGNGFGAPRQRQRRSHELRVVAVQTVQRLQAPERNHDAAMLNQHRREGDYEAGLVELQVLPLMVWTLKCYACSPPSQR